MKEGRVESRGRGDEKGEEQVGRVEKGRRERGEGRTPRKGDEKGGNMRNKRNKRK